MPDDGVDPWNFNHPAFAEAAVRLEYVGYHALSPHRIDRQQGTEPGSQTWEWYMRHALRLLLDSDGVALLPGWANSRGAKIERRLALDLGMDVRFVKSWLAWVTRS